MVRHANESGRHSVPALAPQADGRSLPLGDLPVRAFGEMTGIAFEPPAPAHAQMLQRPSSLWETAVFLTVFVAVVVPILFLVLGSFSPARTPSEFTWSTLSFRNYIKVWS